MSSCISRWVWSFSWLMMICASVKTEEIDPFKDIRPFQNTPSPTPTPIPQPWYQQITWRRELYGLGITEIGEKTREDHRTYLRLAAGLELTTPFSSQTRTFASGNLQLRLMWRDQPLETTLDPMGRDAPEWRLETHNAYLDLLSPIGPPGRFNLRMGRAYLPFGLNVQTDTHASLLPLSNDRLFGTERDWQITAYGNALEPLDYWLGYIFGTGMDQEWKGQHGLAIGRLALANRFLFEQGLEGGVSFAIGERVDPHAELESPIRTWRLGLDARHRHNTSAGPFTGTLELAAGEDNHDHLLSFLGQLDWLAPTRRWSLAIQYWALDRERSTSVMPTTDTAGMMNHAHHAEMTETDPTRGGTQQGATLVGTHYFRNDPAAGSLHWISLALEFPFDASHELLRVRPALHYYRYW